MCGPGGLQCAMLLELCSALEAATEAATAALKPDWALLPPTCQLWAAGMAAATALQDGVGEEGLLDVLAMQENINAEQREGEDGTLE